MKRMSNFVLYAINVGEVEGIVKKRMAEEGWTFPALLDTRSSVADKYGITGHPETFLIDKEGKVAAIAIGPRDWDKERAGILIARLLAE